TRGRKPAAGSCGPSSRRASGRPSRRAASSLWRTRSWRRPREPSWWEGRADEDGGGPGGGRPLRERGRELPQLRDEVPGRRRVSLDQKQKTPRVVETTEMGKRIQPREGSPR